MQTTSPANSVLYPPQLPQMSNGSIDSADLIQEPGVLIVINESPNATQGDYLTLYWNGIQSGLLYIESDSPENYFPWNITIDADLVPDGSYPLYYTRLDAHGNIAVSDTVIAIVRRSDTGILPAPIFPEANDSNTITGDDLADGSTLVQIPAYTGMATGDDVFVYWVGADNTGNVVQDSVYSLMHSVSSTEAGHPFSVQIPAPYVSVIGTGKASAWYTVQPAAGGRARNSDTATTNIDTAQTALLAPYFPEGNDGWIDSSEAMDGTPVAVRAYLGATAGDIVTVSWQGYAKEVPVIASSGSILHTLTSAEIATGFSVVVPAADIEAVGIGTLQAWYSVEFVGDGSGISATATVNIDTVHTQLFPAPTLPEAAGDNTIDSTEYADGTPMQISYPSLMEDDVVTLYWQGYLSDGITPVDGTAWSLVHPVTAAESAAGVFTEIVPASAISPIGNGMATAYYTVVLANRRGIAESMPTNVEIATQSASTLSMNCTTGAPIFDPTVQVRPINTVTLHGPAGEDVTLSLSSTSDAWFNPDGTKTLNIRLDSTGRSSAQVYCFTTGNVTVTAYLQTDPTQDASGVMTFTSWLSGQGDLQYYGMSSNAEADGETLCSVYLQTSAISTAAQARLTLNNNSATIASSGSQVAFVNVSSTHAGSFDLTDKVVEAADFTLMLVDTDDYITGSVTFIAPM